jgi:Na+-translocating ferredoxin:NAD+ oxidoreductase RnfD subunit
MSAARSRWQRVARWRTPVVALLSLVTLIAAAIITWDVDPRELLGFLLVCVIGVGLIIAAAFLFSLLLRLFRR